MVGDYEDGYSHIDLDCPVPLDLTSKTFNDKKEVSGMEIIATLNNYDIIEEIGEENIKKTVGEEYKKWAKALKPEDWEYENVFEGDLSDENIEKEMEKYLASYMEEIESNYHKVLKNTDFSIYVDDNVKVFAKDLKEYEETTLQYIGIMPVEKELDEYIEEIDEKEINNIIKNLKDLKTANFKKGVATKITGFIPKFKFEYELKLKESLESMGIENVFEKGEANLTNISDEKELYIETAIHKANIEFTQDGIKAAAATEVGGAGSGTPFDYIYEIPVEEIDITFDKPYMFLIRDKVTGEVWFIGTVYEPLLWKNETMSTDSE